MAAPAEIRRPGLSAISAPEASGRFTSFLKALPPTIQRLTTIFSGSPHDASTSGHDQGVNGNKDIRPIDELTPDLLEWWSNLPRRIESYTDKQGNPGKILWIGEKEQVMDTFELPWIKETVKQMWSGRRSPPRQVAERGFGLGLMSDEIHEKMKAYQQTEGARGRQQHVIIELNKQVYADAQEWALQKQAEAAAEGRSVQVVFEDSKGNKEPKEAPPGTSPHNMIEILVINGDADQALLEFSDKFFDLIFSDTHQLKPEHLGIHDILKPKDIKRKLKSTGGFTFLVWHRNNQTGKLSHEQLNRIQDNFAEIKIVAKAEITVPDHCKYLSPGKKVLPVVACKYPKFDVA